MKLSEMITQDMLAAHHDRMRRIFLDPLKKKLTDVCVAKLVEQGNMSEATAREFFSSPVGGMMLHSLMGNSIDLLRRFGSNKTETLCNELELISSSEQSYEQIIALLQSKQNVTTCPCGITRTDCTYHK
jgi:hypothetical protein